MGSTFSKEAGYVRLPYETNMTGDKITWLRSPMCAKNCEPLEVPNTNVLVFYSKRDFYPIVIRTQSDNAILNTVLYLKKGLREYCLCNVKNTLRIFIIDVIDQSPIIERVKNGEKIIFTLRFYQARFRTRDTRTKNAERW